MGSTSKDVASTSVPARPRSQFQRLADSCRELRRQNRKDDANSGSCTLFIMCVPSLMCHLSSGLYFIEEHGNPGPTIGLLLLLLISLFFFLSTWLGSPGVLTRRERLYKRVLNYEERQLAGMEELRNFVGVGDAVRREEVVGVDDVGLDDVGADVGADAGADVGAEPVAAAIRDVDSEERLLRERGWEESCADRALLGVDEDFFSGNGEQEDRGTRPGDEDDDLAARAATALGQENVTVIGCRYDCVLSDGESVSRREFLAALPEEPCLEVLDLDTDAEVPVPLSALTGGASDDVVVREVHPSSDVVVGDEVPLWSCQICCCQCASTSTMASAVSNSPGGDPAIQQPEVAVGGGSASGSTATAKVAARGPGGGPGTSAKVADSSSAPVADRSRTDALDQAASSEDVRVTVADSREGSHSAKPPPESLDEKPSAESPVDVGQSPISSLCPGTISSSDPGVPVVVGTLVSSGEPSTLPTIPARHGPSQKPPLSIREHELWAPMEVEELAKHGVVPPQEVVTRMALGCEYVAIK